MFFTTVLLCLVCFFYTQAHGSSLKYRDRDNFLANNTGVERARQNTQRNLCPKIRALDGSCTNNGVGGGNPLWGTAGTAQFSFVPGSSSTRPLRTELASPRLISNVIATQSDSVPNRRGLTELFVVFGQFLDHDMVSTPVSRDEHLDIPIPENDPLRNNVTSGFLGFTRAQRTGALDENAERAINTVTSAIDLSTVYGSSDERLRLLRTFSGGKLRTSDGDFLPFNTGGVPNDPSASPGLFLAGDRRSNQHPAMVSLHTVFLREHNYLCDLISKRRPELSDEQIFRKARVMNIVQMQRIVFEQFYPAMTGRSLPAYGGFRAYANPAISDIFSTAAYRIGHTMFGNNVQRRGPGMTPLPPVDFTQMFFRPAQMFLQNGMDTFLRGIIDTPAQEADTLVSSALRNFLFANVPEASSFVDLIAVNIQRGRDNALPSYNGVRKIFGLPPARRFSDITSSLTVQSQLSTLYSSPEDVDPWVGLMAEDHVPGASMGPTVLLIWEREFTRIRDGDRFFYRNPKMFSRRFFTYFPNFLDVVYGKKDIMKELILRHTSIAASEIPGSLFRRAR